VLVGSARNGENRVCASARLLGMPLFDFYAAHPEESEINDDAMRAFSTAHADALLKTVEFPEDGVVVDVGGGTGALLAAILAAIPPTLRHPV
jgi:hypothetical protein